MIDIHGRCLSPDSGPDDPNAEQSCPIWPLVWRLLPCSWRWTTDPGSWSTAYPWWDASPPVLLSASTRTTIDFIWLLSISCIIIILIKKVKLTERRRKQAAISAWSFRLEVLMERTSSSFCVSQESNKHCQQRYEQKKMRRESQGRF